MIRLEHDDMEWQNIGREDNTLGLHGLRKQNYQERADVAHNNMFFLPLVHVRIEI